MQKLKPRFHLSNDVSRDFFLARTEFQRAHELLNRDYRLCDQGVNALVSEAHIARDGIEPRAVACGAHLKRFLCIKKRVEFAVRKFFASALVALEAFDAFAGTLTAHAPAVFAIEREQPRIKFGEAGAAAWARTFGRKHSEFGLAAAFFPRQNLHDALAVI